MKYGNFVGQGWLPFEKDEAKRIKEHLKSQLVNTFGEDFFKRFTLETNNKRDVKSIIVTAELAKPFNGRNHFGCRVEGCDEVFFFITKNKKGWLEIRDEKEPYNINLYKRDYENCPEFSYGCSMRVLGNEIKYRCRTRQSIQHWKPYTHGTEVEDLTYSKEDLEMLKKSITSR